jgi:uncharacterized OB-fold protein
MTVYTETVLQGTEPFQIAIVTQQDGSRVTGRIEGERVAIGDNVTPTETRDGINYFRKST